MEQQRLPPGFRFSPTDEELLVHYLKNKACGKDYHQGVIAEVDIYKHEPWDLPELSALPSPDPVWYFFNAQDKKHSHSARINRTTGKGYWKATGKDRKICSGPHFVGFKKTLIYYEGRAPSGKRTDWVMHEYKLDEDYEKRSKAICSAVLCRIRRKGGPGPRNGEQFGAAVYNENSEWGEDVDDAVDENVLVPLPHESDVAVSLIKIPKEEVVLDTHTEGLALNGLPPAESVDTSTELDLYMSLETFLADLPDFTSLEADMMSSIAAVDTVQRGQNNFNINMSCESASAVERLLELDNVHDILQPTGNEEQILGELFHLTDTSQGYTNNLSSQAPLYTDGISYSDFLDSSFGDYIEMNDLNAPLDGFVLSSPSYYGIEQQQLPPDLFDEVENLGCSSNLLNAQGLASRRVRLQITPPSGETQRHVLQSGPMRKVHSEVSASSGLTIQIDSSFKSDSEKVMNPISGSDVNGITGRSSAENYFVKDSKTTNLINKIKVQPVIANAVSFAPSLLSTTGCIKEASIDCEAGLNTEGVSCATKATKHSKNMQECGLDCEAGPSSAVVSGHLSKPAHSPSDDENSDVNQLVSKAKGLTLGSRLVELESNLSTTFNDKVFALGKPVARLFPSKNYVNPYHSLRSGAVSSLWHLGLAVLVLLLIFLGIHMLSKYVLLLAA
ncbi:hypothetical protein L7F22_014837 [Adiantum nelumboides]|nr:hypothetical protein [Adiantum nelumboides]